MINYQFTTQTSLIDSVIQISNVVAIGKGTILSWGCMQQRYAMDW